MSDHHPASDGLSVLTHEELMVLEEVLSEKFDDLYRQAMQEVAAMGRFSPEVTERLTNAHTMHEEVLHALRLDLLEHAANLAD